MRPIFALVWHSLQLMASIYEILCLLKIKLHALLLRSYDLFRSNEARERNEAAFLEQCTKQLSKLPRNLCVIVAPESKQVDTEVLSRLFTYALRIGIKSVSVYDRRSQPNGYVELETVVPPKNMRKEISGDTGRSYITWSLNCEESTPLNGVHPKLSQKNGVTNGHLTSKSSPKVRTLKIHKINADDGHALIANVCRELHDARTTPAVKALLEDRTKLSKHIDKSLHQHLGIADPDLGIIFSTLMCTYGVLPWHIRFTEFHQLPSERYFNASAFAELLYKYSRCEQRWGK